MRKYVEKLIHDYPEMLKQRARLQKRIAEYKPLSDDDVISAMVFFQPCGERVQTSSLSDKTYTTAVHYRDRQRQMDADALEEWLSEYEYLDSEITFLEQCIRELPEDLRRVMTALVLDGDSWDEAEGVLNMSRRPIADRRRMAIGVLTREFQKRSSKMEAEMLA